MAGKNADGRETSSDHFDPHHGDAIAP